MSGYSHDSRSRGPRYRILILEKAKQKVTNHDVIREIEHKYESLTIHIQENS